MVDAYLTYSSMDAAALDINTVKTDLLTLLTDVQTEVDGLGTSFQTQTASATFEGVISDFVTGMTKAVTNLENIAGILTGTVDTFEQIDSELANALKG